MAPTPKKNKAATRQRGGSRAETATAQRGRPAPNRRPNQPRTSTRVRGAPANRSGRGASRAGKDTDAPRSGKKNDPSQPVVQTSQGSSSYKIALPLPRELLQYFPHGPHERVALDDPNAAFVTLKVPRRHRTLEAASPWGLAAAAASSTSPPSLVSANASTISKPDIPTLATPGRDGLFPQIFEPLDPQILAGTGQVLDTSFDAITLLHSPPPGPRQPATADGSFRNQLSFESDLPVSERILRPRNMAPVKDTSNVHMTIKDIIQHLSEIQIQTHGYVPETQELLVEKMTDLAESLSRLQDMTSATASPNNYIHQVQIAPEIVDYVDDGRNPDIFTRDFVENVQRGNAVINGKQQAFRDFSEIYAKALKEGIPGVSRQVDKVMRNAGFETENGRDGNGTRHPSANVNGPANGREGG